MPANGPANLIDNLTAAVKVNHPELHDPVIRCPPLRAYPLRCALSASHGGRVSGTLTVLGVEVRTRTYAYSLLYRPVTG